MYSRPVLFDQSPTLADEFSLLQGRTKIAVVFDESGKRLAESLLQKAENIPAAALLVSDSTPSQAISEFVASQKMGTQICIVSQWDTAYRIFSLTVDEGASEEEIQTLIVDQKKRFIYCMKCFSTSEIPSNEAAVQCQCGAHLEVGPFFSKVRKGYIGYPFIPVQQRQTVGS
ncbi:hypothetical protein [Planococcus glaciei]|uniref:Uncharacterized protein n=1 Tax=Planococcus glaciei TaxID=459472 RepID=A0A7H8QC32_9BACL|nr:hypothetical protein [Planococcus glaciei]MBX0315233.1 hypothetical protein [Planococcus glaciei]QKX51112.1 hypothetical protein HF394_11215 [Planococcus glaciei]